MGSISDPLHSSSKYFGTLHYDGGFEDKCYATFSGPFQFSNIMLVVSKNGDQ